MRLWMRVVCWFYGHGDVWIRKVNPVAQVTVYECGECRKIWAEREGVRLTA